MCYEDPRNCSPANETRLNRLPTLDPDGEVTGILTALLRAARQHADFGKWLALKNAWGDDLDGIRAAMADPGREIITAELDGRRAVSAIGTVVAQFGGTPALVLIAGIARGLDDLYGDYLLEPWLRDRLGKGPIQADELVITVQVDGPWRAAFGICRDLLNGDTIAALSQVGVNLVVVPVCSPKTTNLAANAATLAADGPGIVVLANGPRRFRDMAQGSDPYIPMALIATPLDQVLNPTHSAVCSPPQLCTYEFETNRLAAV